MRSKTFFFNPTVFWKNVARFWPLWAAYLAIWIIAMPVPLLSAARWDVFDWRWTVLSYANIGGVIMGAVFGLFSAMAMWGFLCNSRSAYGMASMPVRREALFCTNLLSGYLPLLAANAVTALLTFLAGYGKISFLTVAEWFAIVSLLLLLFYGFATLCAQLTGHLLVLPAVYGILNFVFAGAEFLLRAVFGNFIYGLNDSGTIHTLFTRWLSPVVGLISAIGPEYVYPESAEGLTEAEYIAAIRVVFRGWNVVLLYALAGLLLMAGALLLFRRRKMETAGDVVAVKALKPVFRWCMALGCALLLSSVMYAILFTTANQRTAAFPGTLGFLLLGAFIGWFASEMLMNKTFRVFSPRRWAGLGICCLVIAALMLGLRFDLLGVERRIPEADKVGSVVITANGEQAQFTSPEGIALAQDFHRQVIEDKDWNQDRSYGETRRAVNCYILYSTQDGGTVSRSYWLAYEQEPTEDYNHLKADSRGDVPALNALMNAPEAIQNRKALPFPVTRDNIYYGNVTVSLTAAECAAAAGYDDPGDYLLRERLGFTETGVRAMDPETRRIQIAQCILDQSHNGWALFLESAGDALSRDGADWYYEHQVDILADHIDYDRTYFDYVLTLEPAELWELYSTCVVPDLAEGALGRVWVVSDDAYYDTVYAASIEFGIREKRETMAYTGVSGQIIPTAANDGYVSASFYTVPTADAHRTSEWLMARVPGLHTAGEVRGWVPEEALYFQ